MFLARMLLGRRHSRTDEKFCFNSISASDDQSAVSLRNGPPRKHPVLFRPSPDAELRRRPGPHAGNDAAGLQAPRKICGRHQLQKLVVHHHAQYLHQPLPQSPQPPPRQRARREHALCCGNRKHHHQRWGVQYAPQRVGGQTPASQ